MASRIAKGQARQRAVEEGARLNPSELALLELARYCRDCGGACPFPEIETMALKVKDDEVPAVLQTDLCGCGRYRRHCDGCGPFCTNPVL
jgi:hypothetical protein